MGIDYSTWAGFGARITGFGAFAGGDDPDNDVEHAARVHGCTVETTGNNWTGAEEATYLLVSASKIEMPTETAVRLSTDPGGDLIAMLVRCASALGIVIDQPGWYVGGRVF